MKDYFEKLKTDDEAVKNLGRAIVDDFEIFLMAQKEPVDEVPCSDGLCANSELIRDLKAHLGVDGERKGVEYCKV